MSDIQPLLDELRTVEGNCLYTAQSHFIIARRKTNAVRVVYVGSAVISAVAGVAVTIGAPPLFAIIPAITGATGAVAAALGADKDIYQHTVAGNVLTRLRQEARALREAFAPGMTREALLSRVQEITTSYNALIQSLPTTDDSSMQKARKLIHAGTFHPDFRAAEQQAARQLPSPDEPAKLPPSTDPSHSG